MSELENFKNKLLYRSSYRGTKEMDILLSNFVKLYINKFNKNQLLDLEKLLNTEDEIIYNYYQNNILHKDLKPNKILELFKNFKV
ncbi:MAG: succinate dehydrogenase assembly factor 2 [Candidatus Pelagibacter sp.]|nr:succinate dehydrogenase assembly factor 2 [Candidatus Pelagibacter sp.]|tara:strand:+ start:346 stop:600 length:255 start_codon:yes stop_codon:yes gene_type:complete